MKKTNIYIKFCMKKMRQHIFYKFCKPYSLTAKAKSSGLILCQSRKSFSNRARKSILLLDFQALRP